MYFTVMRWRVTAARRSSTSSPGSMTTPSSVSGHARTKPFFSKGGTELTSTMSGITGEPPRVAFSHYRAGGHMDRSPEVRVHTSLLADVEKQWLIWMARRLPAVVNSDHLTAL